MACIVSIVSRFASARVLDRLLASIVACVCLGFSAGQALAQPVLITAPQTINPGATTITPTAGGAPVPLVTADITVSGTTLTVNGRHTVRNLVVQNNATITHDAAFTFDYSFGAGTDVVSGLWLNVQANPTGGNLTIASGGIDVSGKGYPAATGPGAGGSINDTSAGGGGGGHGGNGADSLQIPGGSTYGSSATPTTLGSGGGSYISTFGGAGGGAVRLIVSGTLTHSGNIYAVGIQPGQAAGGGAGGSIWITAGSLVGNGGLYAYGGNGGSNAWGGGGGGRIAIDNSTANFSGVIAAYGGGANNGNGGPGSIYLASASPRPALIFDNFGNTGASTLTQPLVFTGDVFMRRGAWFTHAPGNTSGLTVNITGDLSIDSSCQINVNGKGYPAATGPGAGGSINDTSAGGGGGGHGGNGADSLQIPGGITYGSSATPTTLGSGGGSYISTFGGAGGGAVRLIVSGTLTHSGNIYAVGIQPGQAAGGGAGGSIWITAGSLVGNGGLYAYGGNGGSNAWGGGGGGRIAVYSCTSSATFATSVAGGSANNGNGQPGTLFLGTSAVSFDRATYSACPGSTATIAAKVGGTGPFTYQWERSLIGAPGVWLPLASGAVPGLGIVSGTTGDTLTISAVEPTTNVAALRVTVTGACGGPASSLPLAFNVDCVPFNSASPTQNAYFVGTRSLPTGGGTGEFAVRNLDILPGSSFGLGSGETLNLNGGAGRLLVNVGAVLQANGTILGNIINAGLVIIPITRAELFSSILGGVIDVQPGAAGPVLPPLSLPPGTLVNFAPPAGGGGATLDSPGITGNGTTTWDGQLTVTGSFTQTETGFLRLFIAGDQQGQTYSLLSVNQSVSLAGGVQIALQPELFGFVPSVGATFDVIQATGGITLPAGGLSAISVQSLITQAGNTQLNLGYPAFVSGFAADPDSLAVVPQNLFTLSLVNNGTTLRATMTAPLCVGPTAPAGFSRCPGAPGSVSVTPRGSGPFTFQWRKRETLGGTPVNIANDARISGATSATLSFSTLVNVDTGYYDCLVTGGGAASCGPTASALANVLIGCNNLSNVASPGQGQTCDDELTADDIIVYLNWFFAADLRANVSGPGQNTATLDGELTADDIIVFLNRFFAGC